MHLPFSPTPLFVRPLLTYLVVMYFLSHRCVCLDVHAIERDFSQLPVSPLLAVTSPLAFQSSPPLYEFSIWCFSGVYSLTVFLG